MKTAFRFLGTLTAAAALSSCCCDDDVPFSTPDGVTYTESTCWRYSSNRICVAHSSPHVPGGARSHTCPQQSCVWERTWTRRHDGISREPTNWGAPATMTETVTTRTAMP